MNNLFKSKYAKKSKVRILYLFFFVLLFFPNLLYPQAPKIQWQKSLGGTDYEVANCIIQTSDKGYAIAAYAVSKDGDVSGNHGSGDAWIIKLDSTGTVSWKKCFGGSGDDYANWIIQTTDGGYVFTGRTGSSDGDVIGFHGGDFDAWVVKLNSDGNIKWQKCFGGSGYDQANNIIQCSDGGFALCGVTYSQDGDVIGNHEGPGDAWIIKLDSAANIQWQKCIGGSGNDEAISIIQNSKKGYAVAGRTTSTDGDITGYHGGDFDALVITIDSSGHLEWLKCYGGDSLEHFHSIIQSYDGGYAVCGHSSSINGEITHNHGDMDAWIVKLDTSGNIQWQNSLGGSGDDGAYSIRQASDHGYVAAGWSSSTDANVIGGHGADDILFAKLDSAGKIEWQQCYGGSKPENANSMVETLDGGCAIVGFTNSSDGDVFGYHGGEDVWIIKLGYENSVSAFTPEIYSYEIYPNPSNQDANISYVLSGRSSVKIEIINLLGQTEKKIFDGVENGGSYTKRFSIMSLSNGEYFLKFDIDGVCTSRSFNVLR